MVNEKDVMRKLKYFAGIAAALMLWGCSEDKFVPDQYLNGLGGDEYVLNEIDEWIIDNYTRPYNMDVKYRWDQSELDLNRTLVPIKEELVVSVMKVVQEIWIKPYEQLAGANFIRSYSPKKYVLVGSPKYNPNTGTITLGEAEGGRKIVLYRLNWFDLKDRDLIQQIMKTVHHEFGHTLHQTILYPEEFKNITPGGYTTSWNNMSEEEALKLGYVSSYACAGPDEDFVEMIARIAVFGPEWYEKKVARAKELYLNATSALDFAYDPSEALRQKETIVVSYLKDIWGINFYDQDGEKGLVTLVQEAIDYVTSDDYKQ